MRVLLISGAFPPMASGEATNTFHLCRHLADRGLDVHVLTTEGNTAGADPRIRVHAVMRTWSWGEAPRLARVLKQVKPDVVYHMFIGYMYGFQFMSTFVPTIAKRVLPNALVVTRFENIHGAFARHNSLVSRGVRKIVERLDSRNVDFEFGTLLRDSDTVIVLSANHGDALEKRLPGVAGRSVLLPPPSNMRMSAPGMASREKGRQALHVGPDDFLVSYIGFLYPGKGIETLLRAFQLLKAGRPSAKLAMIGGNIAKAAAGDRDYFAEMRTLAGSLGIGNDVIWTGEYSFDSDDASLYLRASDACVLPFDAGLSLNNSSFSSAAAHGLPIVTTDAGRLERAFVDRNNVLLCPPQSPAALANAISTVMDDAELRATLGEGALRLAREWYSWDSAIEKQLAIFRPAGTPASAFAG
jgi:polysaccharide biosynthesis protein PslF